MPLLDENAGRAGRACYLSVMLTYSTIPIGGYTVTTTLPEYRSRPIFDRLQESEEVHGTRV